MKYEVNESQVAMILENYRSVVKNTEEALELSGVPKKQVPLYTVNIPEFNRLFPSDVVSLYQTIKTAVIYFLDDLGMSRTEIARRLGGSSTFFIHATLAKRKELTEKDIQLGSFEEVTNEDNGVSTAQG